MKRELVQEKIASIGPYDLEGSVENAIEAFSVWKTCDGYERTYIEVEIDWFYECPGVPQLLIMGERYENDKELEKRKQRVQKAKEKAAKRKATIKEKELKILERLKKKYE